MDRTGSITLAVKVDYIDHFLLLLVEVGHSQYKEAMILHLTFSTVK